MGKPGDQRCRLGLLHKFSSMTKVQVPANPCQLELASSLHTLKLGHRLLESDDVLGVDSCISTVIWNESAGALLGSQVELLTVRLTAVVLAAAVVGPVRPAAVLVVVGAGAFEANSPAAAADDAAYAAVGPG